MYLINLQLLMLTIFEFFSSDMFLFCSPSLFVMKCFTQARLLVTYFHISQQHPQLLVLHYQLLYCTGDYRSGLVLPTCINNMPAFAKPCIFLKLRMYMSQHSAAHKISLADILTYAKHTLSKTLSYFRIYAYNNNYSS